MAISLGRHPPEQVLVDRWRSNRTADMFIRADSVRVAASGVARRRQDAVAEVTMIEVRSGRSAGGERPVVGCEPARLQRRRH
jgi:hypothetical protein